MSEQHITPAVAPEIEEAYAEIGRTVVEAALRQAQHQPDPAGAEAGVETTVTIRLLMQAGGPAEMRPVVCCFCTRDTEGVWVCSGACCPKGDPPW